jgi:type VI secretion system secreted protein VgrG
MNAPGFSTLGLFGTGLSQHARLITLTSSQDSGLPESLAAEQFSGREAVNELFCFDVDALSTSTDLDIGEFIGEELTVGLLQPDGSRRAWHGLCTGAAWVGADGGLARYRLRLEPALALLALRRDSYIFQDKNVRDIVTELLADYPQVAFDFDITQDLPKRAVCTQYRESDLAFFTRLLASEGLSWRFEHEPEGLHRLIIFDGRARAPAPPGGDIIRFHGVRATERDDAIDGFSARRTLTANAVAISSWDPGQLLAPACEQRSNLDAGKVPALWLYDGSGERIASTRVLADTHSELMLQALEFENKAFEGTGAARRLAAGHRFRLTQHDRYPNGDNAFTALWVRHEARNNFDTGIAASVLAGVEKGTYRNSFGCARDTVALVPALTAGPCKVTAPGAQCALVVGLADSVSTTTRDHQVRIQFAWQRGGRPNPGGLAHDTDDKGCAPGDERSGTWVRVAEALAGPNWGTLFTPRVGTEVLVDFIEGDIDRPVVVAQLFTGPDLPPFAAGVDSGVEHAGTLSGIHSHNFDGGGFNQWQIDDTAGQVRTRLATSTAATQLNLGYLIQQSPGSAQRGAWRGTGFELRTDAWGAVRGGEGVLLSTSERSQQGCGVTSTQMDAHEAVSLLKGAQGLGKTLGDAAAQQQALFSKDAAAAQSDFIEQVDPKEKGKYAGAVNGQTALKAKSGSREPDGSQPVEKFGTAIVLMDSAASINWATPASTVIYAGKQLQWTAQSDLHLTAAHTVASVAANAASLFTHSGGIQAIAGNGPLSLQAHTDGLEIVADKEITVISVNDCIEIKAKQKIVLQAGQAAVTLEGGDITFACPGKFSVKGGKHFFDKGSKRSSATTPLPDTRVKLFAQQIRAVNEATGEPIAQLSYKMETGDGDVFYGDTDDDGNTIQTRTVSQQAVKVWWGVLPPGQDGDA